jgi:hypothetical protein
MIKCLAIWCKPILNPSLREGLADTGWGLNRDIKDEMLNRQAFRKGTEG